MTKKCYCVDVTRFLCRLGTLRTTTFNHSKRYIHRSFPLISDHLFYFVYENMEVLYSCGRVAFAIITISCWIFCFTSSPAIACPFPERNLLVDFKVAVVDEYNTLSSWHGFNCCTWRGVSCSIRTRHVSRLDLSGFNLEGNISSSLFQLELEHLDLSDNLFQGNFSPPYNRKLKTHFSWLVICWICKWVLREFGKLIKSGELGIPLSCCSEHLCKQRVGWSLAVYPTFKNSACLTVGLEDQFPIPFSTSPLSFISICHTTIYQHKYLLGLKIWLPTCSHLISLWMRILEETFLSSDNESLLRH